MTTPLQAFKAAFTKDRRFLFEARGNFPHPPTWRRVIAARSRDVMLTDWRGGNQTSYLHWPKASQLIQFTGTERFEITNDVILGQVLCYDFGAVQEQAATS